MTILSFLGIGKKVVAADLAGNNITAALLDADECWEDVCSLRDYSTSGPIASCEIAFARTGLLHFIFSDTQNEDVARRMKIASTSFVVDAFSTQDTDETRKHYKAALGVAAIHRVLFYEKNAFPNSQLASALGAELTVPGVPSVEITPIFESVERRVRKLISGVRIK